MVGSKDSVPQNSNRLYFWLAAASAVIVMACAGICVVLDAALFPGRYAGSVAVSPDRRYEAQAYGTNCGAPCDFHAWVDVRDRRVSWLPWPLPIDVDTVGLDLSERVFDEETDPCLVVAVWEDDRALTVYVPGRPDPNGMVREPRRWRNVEIEFLPISESGVSGLESNACWDDGTPRLVRQRLEIFPAIGLLALVGVPVGYFGLRRFWRA